MSEGPYNRKNASKRTIAVLIAISFKTNSKQGKLEGGV